MWLAPRVFEPSKVLLWKPYHKNVCYGKVDLDQRLGYDFVDGQYEYANMYVDFGIHEALRLITPISITEHLVFDRAPRLSSLSAST